MATKRLALELGLVQKRKLKGSLAVTSDAKQEFYYLVVLDFESTCWENGPRMGRQEVIEFPAVLLDLATGKIVSEFHHYVMPVEQPILSEFCTKLTGITQNQVENGIPLGTCLGLFTSWIRKLCDQHQISFNTSVSGKHGAFATWSDWDLGVCLHYECSRKHLKKPDFFNQWIDIKLTYKNFYQRRPQGLAGALKDLGISFEGREHSGICDTRNTAVLVARMVRDGCIFKITKSLAPKTKGSSVKEAAQKLFNQVKDAVLGKRKHELGQDKKNSPKKVKLKSSCVLKPIEINTDADNNVNHFVNIDFNLGLSGLVGREILSKTRRNCNATDENVIEQKTGNAVCNNAGRALNIPVPPTVAIQNPVLKEKATPVNSNTLKSCGVATNSFITPVLHSYSSSSNMLNGVPSGNRFPGKCLTSNQSCVADMSVGNSKGFHTYKRTPPFCGCGRRAKLLTTSKPGPNLGRYFFSCPNSGNGIKKGCKFFKWEDEPFVRTPLMTSFFTPAMHTRQDRMARSLPPLQHGTRTIGISDIRAAASEPAKINKMRCIGLSRNISSSNNPSQRKISKENSLSANNGISHNINDSLKTDEVEITPYIVKHKSKVK